MTRIDTMAHNEAKVGAGATPSLPHGLALTHILQAQPALDIGVLIDSQVAGTSTVESYWGIALQWSSRLDWLAIVGNTDTLRRRLANAVGLRKQVSISSTCRVPFSPCVPPPRRNANHLRENAPWSGLIFCIAPGARLTFFAGTKATRFDLYHAEAERLADEHQAILDKSGPISESGRHFTPLEEWGVMHTLQIIIENVIGKAKYWLKANNRVVLVSAYGAFNALASANAINQQPLSK